MPSELCSHCPFLFSLALPVFCAPLLSWIFFGPATRSPWQVHGDSISLNVTEPFPFLWHWHCVVRRSCPLAVAAGNRCHAGGWHIVHEAARLASWSPLFLTVHALVCAAQWKIFTALSRYLQCTMVANVPLGARVWWFDKTTYIGSRDVVSHLVAPMCSRLSLSSHEVCVSQTREHFLLRKFVGTSKPCIGILTVTLILIVSVPF